MVSAAALIAAGLIGMAAQPALAADLCTGTAGLNLVPGVHITEVRDIDVTQQGTQAGSLLCTVDPLLGTLVAKTVDVHISGNCLGTTLDNSQASTIIVRFPGESSDSTINITSVALTMTSVSKVITFHGTVQAGHPHQNQNTELAVASTGATTECLTTQGLTQFTGAATFLFT
jgi:hypothetical protein